MTSLTPDQIAADWAAKLASSTSKITAGVNAVTTAPGQAAARKSDLWATNVAAAKAKYARNVAAVTTQDWQQAMINKGIPRVASGAQASQQKFATFMGKLLPYQAQLQGTLGGRGTLEQNIARMDAWVRGMAKFSNS